MKLDASVLARAPMLPAGSPNDRRVMHDARWVLTLDREHSAAFGLVSVSSGRRGRVDRDGPYSCHFSPTLRTSAAAIVASSSRIPASRRARRTIAAESMRCSRRALRTTPSVPITLTPSTRAAVRARPCPALQSRRSTLLARGRPSHPHRVPIQRRADRSVRS